MATANSQDEAPTVESLPTEILTHVFSFLDSDAPSESRLHDQPYGGMLRRPGSQTLKSVSLVSRRWRGTVLPLLFRNSVWTVDRRGLAQIREQCQNHPENPLPLMSFIQANRLTSYVKSLTLIIAKISNLASTSPLGLYRLGDGSGQYGYSPEPVGGCPGSRTRVTSFNEDTNWLWEMIFESIDPLRFTIIACPRVLASLFSRMLFLGDAWSFSVSHHILSLSRDNNHKDMGAANETAASSKGKQPQDDTLDDNDDPASSMPSPPPLPMPPPPKAQASSSRSAMPQATRPECKLFTIRPWTRLLLNEGSFISVYRTYEWYHKRPPSVLGALLGAGDFPNDVALVPPTVRDLSYVGIFPLSAHFNTLVQHLPRVDRLFVQLVPRSNMLDDRFVIQNLDVNDLWLERNTSYSMVIPKLFETSRRAGNWPLLREFESGDAADRESWEMAVQYVLDSGSGWRVEREGVFVKKQPGEVDSNSRDDGYGDDDDDGDDEDEDERIHSDDDEDFEPGSTSSSSSSGDDDGPNFDWGFGGQGIGGRPSSFL